MLFQPLPTPPEGVASWVELQTLAAAWFTWKAAQHARVQADEAQDELRIAREGRGAESRVRAFELLSLLDDWFRPELVPAPTPTALLRQLEAVIRFDYSDGSPVDRRQQVREEGVRIAAGIQPATVLVQWIQLFDHADELTSRARVLREEFAALLREAGLKRLGAAYDSDEPGDRERAEECCANASSLRFAQLAVAQFWHGYNAFRDRIESIGRAGAHRPGPPTIGTTVTGTP